MLEERKKHAMVTRSEYSLQNISAVRRRNRVARSSEDDRHNIAAITHACGFRHLLAVVSARRMVVIILNSFSFYHKVTAETTAAVGPGSIGSDDVLSMGLYLST
jgi:hypothetical protein